MNAIFRSKVLWIVVVFLILLVAAFAAEAKEPKVSIGLTGGTLESSELITQRLGVSYGDWYARAEKFGGENYNDIWGFTFARRVHVGDWKVHPFLEFGAMYTDDELTQNDRPLVSDTLTFHLSAGLVWRLSALTEVEVSWIHNSTAERADINDGIDRAFVGFNWAF